jgi:hypothetical protein
MIKEQTHNSAIGGPRSYILLIPWPINYFELRTKSFLQSIFNNFSDIPVYLYRGAKGIYNPHTFLSLAYPNYPLASRLSASGPGLVRVGRIISKIFWPVNHSNTYLTFTVK